MKGPVMLALAIVIIGGLTIVAADVLGFLDVSDGRAASLVGLLAIGVWIGPGFLARYRSNGSAAVMHLAIWLAIATVLAVLFLWQEPILAFLGQS